MNKKLSKREYEVLNLVSKGYKNKHIANELNINQKTIGTYMLRLKTKLGLRNDQNSFFVVVRAVELGILSKMVFFKRPVQNEN